ncbi:MAG: protein-glutamate O-methyltransferase CheR [Oligoflexales bacterium]
MSAIEIENLEIELFLEGVFKRYGYDFRNYARASLHRRINMLLDEENHKHITNLLADILYNDQVFKNFLQKMSITVTEMFRDHNFFIALRKKILPKLCSFPRLKIWHAGCATGEEVYSTAIVLYEAGLLERSIIYATDYNNISLEAAKLGVYSSDLIKAYTMNYNKSEGESSFSEYYLAKYGNAIMDSKLKKNIVFSHHNLVSDGVFGNMNLVICRNVLIYFNKELQDHVLNKLADSLDISGFLCLGGKETIDYSSISEQFRQVTEQKIYQKRSVRIY